MILTEEIPFNYRINCLIDGLYCHYESLDGFSLSILNIHLTLSLNLTLRPNMPISSDWTLTEGSSRFLLPLFLTDLVSKHALSKELYPTAFGHYRSAKGHIMQREEHEDFLMIYCTQGSGFVSYKEQSYKVTAGTLFILPKGLPHEYGANNEDPWSIYWSHFSGQQAHVFIGNLINTLKDRSEFQNNNLVFSVGLHPKLISDFENLLESRQSGYSLLPFLHAANQLRQILSYLSILITKTKQQSQLDLDCIHALMIENIHARLDLDSIAKSVNLSKFHFCKKYKSLTGNTPIQHFIHLKMEHACYLLDTTNKSVGEIAHNLSYEDPHYFSRVFKKVIGVSASHYRDSRSF